MSPPGVLTGIERMTRLLEDGITSIGFETFGRSRGKATITSEARARLRAAVSRPESAGSVSVVGVIWEADWRNHTAEIHEADGHVVRIEFNADRDEEITEARRRRVRVKGPPQMSGDRVRSIAVEDMAGDWPEDEPLDDFLDLVRQGRR